MTIIKYLSDERILEIADEYFEKRRGQNTTQQDQES